MSRFRQIFTEYILPRLVIDIIVFFLLLILGGLLATRLNFTLDFFLGATSIYLMLIFAFIINDIEDREDDAKVRYEKQSMLDNIKMVLGFETTQDHMEGVKRFRNIFAFNILSPRTGWIVLSLLAIISTVLAYLAGGIIFTLLALSNLIVGFLYSWKNVRLKSIAGLDILSHSYLLAGVQILSIFAYPNAQVTLLSWILLIVVVLNSISGDLKNEYRDFTIDQETGVHNTAGILGKKLTRAIVQIMNPLTSIFILLIALYFVLERSGFVNWGI